VALNRKIMEGATGYLELRSAITVYKPPQVLGTIVNGVEEAVGRSASPGGIFEDSNLADSKYESRRIGKTSEEKFGCLSFPRAADALPIRAIM
jgi:hypothetical protein